MDELRVLVLGSGAREDALIWKLDQSPRVRRIFALPGNGGTARHGKAENVAHVSADDFAAVTAFAQAQQVDLVIPGPEAPLVEGIATACRAAGLRCFGPSPQAARMEGSKAFAKDFMARHAIPTARYGRFRDVAAARAFVEQADGRLVLKADGLAAGKGVLLTRTKEEALAGLQQILVDKAFGGAGDEVVIEEFLEGQELSVLTFSDGYTLRSLPPAQDHKQIRDGDQGPMTGGMGCYAPTKVATPELVEEIERRVLRPTIDGMRREGMPFVGTLFTGLMVTAAGPRVLEYNVRFGDPECETLLPLLAPGADLVEIMLACTDHYLDAVTIPVEPGFAATVIAVAGGYPGNYAKGEPIAFQPPPKDALIFHAGTKGTGDGRVVTNGGRVLACTATGADLQTALARAYAALESVSFPGMFFRKDIGHRALRPAPDAAATTSTTTGATPAPMTYAAAGVSVDAGNALIPRIAPLAASTARSGADASLGGFGGLFSLAAAFPADPNNPSNPNPAGGSPPPLLVAGIDGVGTKLFLAHALGTPAAHAGVGRDLVAMNVNDLVVQGAEPLFFLDCFTCNALDPAVAAAFVEGVAAACREAGCALVGGETAEMPGLLRGVEGVKAGGVYDAVGAAVGAIPHGQAVLPEKAAMRAGDALVGVGASGMHSNGFSLVRRILDAAGLKPSDRAPWATADADLPVDTTVGADLLTPTRLYVRPLLRAARRGLLRGMAHVTGGGLPDNVPRMLPRALAAELDAAAWPLPPAARWLGRAGNVAPAEMARTWNCGLGMVLVVAPEQVGEVKALLAEAELWAGEVGKLVPRVEGAAGCVVRNMERWRE